MQSLTKHLNIAVEIRKRNKAFDHSLYNFKTAWTYRYTSETMMYRNFQIVNQIFIYIPEQSMTIKYQTPALKISVISFCTFSFYLACE